MPWKMQAIATTPGHEQRREVRLAPACAADALPDLREHVGEHEDEQQRLHDRADDERGHALAQDREVAQQQRAERGRSRAPDGAAPRRVARRRGRGAHSRRSFPVRLMNTVSSVGSVTERSVT